MSPPTAKSALSSGANITAVTDATTTMALCGAPSLPDWFASAIHVSNETTYTRLSCSLVSAHQIAGRHSTSGPKIAQPALAPRASPATPSSRPRRPRGSPCAGIRQRRPCSVERDEARRAGPSAAPSSTTSRSRPLASAASLASASCLAFSLAASLPSASRSAFCSASCFASASAGACRQRPEGAWHPTTMGANNVRPPHDSAHGCECPGHGALGALLSS